MALCFDILASHYKPLPRYLSWAIVIYGLGSGFSQESDKMLVVDFVGKAAEFVPVLLVD